MKIRRVLSRVALLAAVSLPFAGFAHASQVTIAVGSEASTLDPQKRDDGGERAINDKAEIAIRKLTDQPIDDGNGGIVRRVRAEDDFVQRIVLLAERPQALIERRRVAVDRLENRYAGPGFRTGLRPLAEHQRRADSEHKICEPSEPDHDAQNLPN